MDCQGRLQEVQLLYKSGASLYADDLLSRIKIRIQNLIAIQVAAELTVNLDILKDVK